jgi:uncharacterized protein YggE
MGEIMKLLAIVFGIIFLAAFLANVEGANQAVTVVGEGTVTVAADAATISVSVQSQNDNMTQAQDEVQEKMNSVLDVLKSTGVKDEEILSGQSNSISAFHSQSNVCRTINNTTVCMNSTDQISSLERSAVIRLKTSDQSRIDRVVDAAKSAGAKAYLAGYGLSDTKEAVADARQKAVANAKENAEGMADAAGARLGEVLEISDYAYPYIEAADGAEETGMVRVTSYVVVTYEILT